MKRIVIAITGASGSLYAQRLMENLEGHAEVMVALSSHAEEVAACEIDGLRIPDGFKVFGDKSMQVPFVSGSALSGRNPIESLVIIPCSMGTLGRIAHGFSDSAITRSADVFLKEKRQLIIVPRETPWNLIQARNVVTVMEAGATVIPAIPSFYTRPDTVEAVVDTVVARVLDHLGVENSLVKRWKSEQKDAPSLEE